MAKKPNIKAGIDKNIFELDSIDIIYQKHASGDGVILENKRWLNLLSSAYGSMSLVLWFRDQDLRAAKNAAYIAGFINRIRYNFSWLNNSSGCPEDMFYSLLSDNEELLHWESQYCLSPLFAKSRKSLVCEMPSQIVYQYFSIQPRLALAKQWELLEDRCQAVLNLPEPKKYKQTLIDYRFFLALAQKDEGRINEALAELLAPRVISNRNREMRWGLEDQLFLGDALLYAKLAAREGFTIEVESPWLPKELIPYEPLDEYTLPHPCFESFDLFSPISNVVSKEGYDDLNPSEFSPRPPSDDPLTYKQQLAMMERYK